MSGFELSEASQTLDREGDGQVVHLRDVAGDLMYFGDDEPVTVTVVGTYSKKYRKVLDAQISKAAKVRRRDPEDIQRASLEVMAQCVLDWQGFFDNGAPLECTRANVLRVLELAVWVKEQIEVAMDDHAAFSVASQPN